MNALPKVLIDEIALEGLEGITLPDLWTRVKHRLGGEFHEGSKIYNVCLNFLTKQPCERIQCFKLKDPRSSQEEKIVYKMIETGGVKGLSSDFDSRKEIPMSELNGKIYEEVSKLYGNTLIFVASQKERNAVLFPDYLSVPTGWMSVSSYCLLEKVGQSRDSGITTNSLRKVISEYSTMFHFKKMLIRNGFLKEFTFKENRKKIIRVFLPKYFKRPKSDTEDLRRFLGSEWKLYDAVKDWYQKELKNGNKSWKGFLNSPLFQNEFQVETLLYRQLYPDATSNEYLTKSGIEKKLKIIREKDKPTLDNEDKESDDDDDDDEVFLDTSKQWIKIDVRCQFLSAIKDSGNKGLSQVDLKKTFGFSHLIVRNALKILSRDKKIKFYTIERRRQRIKMFVLYDCDLEKVQEPLPIAMQKENDIQPPQVIEQPDLLEMELEERYQKIHVKIEKQLFKDQKPKVRDQTKRQIDRIKLISKFISDEEFISDIFSIVTFIKTEEKKLGYTDTICRKTVTKNLSILIESNLIAIYDITLTNDNLVKTSRVCCDVKKCGPKDNRFISNIEQLKMGMFVFNANEDEEVIEAPPKDPSFKPSLKAPKLLRASSIHKLMYYIKYGISGNAKPLNKNDIIDDHWRNTLAVDYDSIRKELPAIYCHDIGWKTFIPPLDEELKKDGFLQLKDFLIRIPLSIFMEVSPPLFHIPNLHQFLDHPIKKFYTVYQLPNEIKGILFYKNLYIYNVLSTIDNLCRIGLVRIGPFNGKWKKEMYFYLNKKAEILDTKGSYLESSIDPDQEYAELKYEFNSMEKVNEYWDCLKDICLKTSFTTNNDNVKNVSMPNNALDPITFDEGFLLDTGIPPGDRIGAAGLHSGLRCHLSQYWSNKKIKKAAAPLKKGVKQSKYDHLRAIVKKVANTKIHRTGIKPRDEVDRSIIKPNRVGWTEMEDNVILLCQVTADLLEIDSRNKMFPTYMVIMRDILHWRCLSLEKTSMTCHRRLKNLTTNNVVTVSNLKACHEELKKNEEIKMKYGDDFIKSLRQFYMDKDELQSAFKVHFVNLYRLVSANYSHISSTEVTRNKMSCLPNTIKELWAKFNNIKTKEENVVKLETENDIHVTTIYNLIYSSMCCAQDKVNYNMQLFDIYKNYPDLVLDEALNRIRIDGVVSTNRTKKLSDTALPHSPYNLSNIYRLQLKTVFDYQVFDLIWEKIKIMQSQNISLKNVDNSFSLLLASIQTENSKRILINSSSSEDQQKSKVFTRNFLTRPKVSFKDDIDIKEFCYTPLEKLLKINPINYHVVCYINKRSNNDGKKKLSTNIKVSEDNICEHDCLIPKIEYLERFEDLIMACELIPYQKEIKQVISNIAPLKTMFIEQNKKDLGSKRPKRPLDINGLIREIKEKSEDYLNDLSIRIESGLVERINPHISKEEIKDKLLKISVYNPPSRNLIKEVHEKPDWSKVVDIAEQYKIVGVSCKELLIQSNLTKNKLEEILKALLDLSVLIICGIDEIKLVHFNHIEPWIIKSYHILRLEREQIDPTTNKRKLLNDIEEATPHKTAKLTISGEAISKPADSRVIFLRPSPWVRISGTINQRVLDKWLGTILLYLYEKSGCTMANLNQRFYMSGVHLRMLLEVLVDMKCISVKRFQTQKANLFSTFNTNEIEFGSLLMDSEEELFLEPTVDSMIQYTTTIGDKSYKTDFV